MQKKIVFFVEECLTLRNEHHHLNRTWVSKALSLLLCLTVKKKTNKKTSGDEKEGNEEAERRPHG